MQSIGLPNAGSFSSTLLASCSDIEGHPSCFRCCVVLQWLLFMIVRPHCDSPIWTFVPCLCFNSSLRAKSRQLAFWRMWEGRCWLVLWCMCQGVIKYVRLCCIAQLFNTSCIYDTKVTQWRRRRPFEKVEIVPYMELYWEPVHVKGITTQLQ